MNIPKLPGRRIVTFTDYDGRSKFWSRDRPAVVEFRTIPGLRTSTLWATGEPTLKRGMCADPAPGLASLVPDPGGSIFLVVTIPPDSVYSRPDFDPEAAKTEQAEHMPGLIETMEAEAPGFHTTDTVDYAVLLAGEIWLELDGEEKCLSAGDCVVQLGSRHAWRNRSNSAATLAFILLGARRLP